MRRAKSKKEKAAAASKTTQEPPLPGAWPVVMIGASAGGLEMFQQFFAQMPPDSGLAFVLIQHLDPNHETLIPELLTKYTSMPVQRVLEPVALQPNQVYVIPANALLTMEKGTLQVCRPASGPSDRTPIDYFLRSV